jgi:hypothetical protein
MKSSEIVAGERYVVDVAPRHPITAPKVCTVVAVTNHGDGWQVEVAYSKLVPVDARMTGASTLREFVAKVRPTQVLYDMAERQRRIAVEQQWFEFWRAHNAGEVRPVPVRAVA